MAAFQEIQIIKRLTEENQPVPRYIKSWEEKSPIILEMEYCKLDLAQFIQLRRRQNLLFSEEELVLVLTDLFRAIEALHALGYAHMDIKPGMLYFTQKTSLLPKRSQNPKIL